MLLWLNFFQDHPTLYSVKVIDFLIDGNFDLEKNYIDDPISILIFNMEPDPPSLSPLLGQPDIDRYGLGQFART